MGSKGSLFIRNLSLRAGLIFLVLVLPVIPLFSQALSHHLKHKTNLCKETMETSGLLYLNGNVWTFNDSGGKPELYEVDTANGKLIRKVRISNASDVDWEAITADDKYIYIGDVGNNMGQRSACYIYRISCKDILKSGNNEVAADTIIFTYAGQKGKKAIGGHSFYDCEAIFCLNDTIYLINKNWTNQSQAVMYRIPAKPGHYIIRPFESLAADGLICDAAVSPDKKFLIMVGYNDFMPFASLYEIITKNPLKIKKLSSMEYPKFQGLQTEGCTFINDEEVFISCEQNKFFTNALYRVRVK